MPLYKKVASFFSRLLVFIGVGIVFSITGLQAQPRHIISGYIFDIASSEAISSVRILETYTQQSTLSDRYGFFHLAISHSDTLQIEIQHPAYQNRFIRLTQIPDSLLRIGLAPIELDSVEIQASATSIGQLSFAVQRLNQMPALGGEADLLKSLAMLPGVSLGSEASSGLWVRGGSPDQTLILLDEAPVYNVSHFFGFLSTFHPDALKDFTLYKGAFPARYGGRLSGILDLTMKEGNQQKRHHQYRVSPVSISGLTEGPIQQGKGSYLFTGRLASTSVLLFPLRLAYLRGSLDQSVNLGFYDLNAKINLQLGKTGRLYVSAYSGWDTYKVDTGRAEEDQNSVKLGWGNQTATIRYVSPIGQSNTLKLVSYVTRYRYQTGFESQSTLKRESQADSLLTASLRFQSGLTESGTRAEMTSHLSSRLQLQYGLIARGRFFRPEVVEQDNLRTPANTLAQIEAATYAELTWILHPQLSLVGGLRAVAQFTESKTYPFLAPRLRMIGKLDKTEWGLAFSQMQQSIHVLFNSGLGLPNDLWIPITDRLPPQLGWQISGNVQRPLGQGWSATIETYYKSQNQLVAFQQGANVLGSFDQDWESLVQSGGEGRSYGLEILLQKSRGQWKGWLAYEWAMQERRFTDINQGHWYPARYDRRHQIEATIQRQVGEKWQLAANAVFQTGHPITMPIALLPNISDPSSPTPFWQLDVVYGDRNNVRMPAYHRVDFAANRTRNRRTWTFGIYNVYGRQNPFFLDIRRVRNSSSSTPAAQWQLVQYSLMPFLPYVSFKKTW